MRRTNHTRQLPRADMTPLVNIALLLIVFFVWVKQSQRPVTSQLELPNHGKIDGEYMFPLASIFLLEDNRIGYLSYNPDKASADYLETDYSINGLRKQLLITASAKHPVVYIVPTAQSTVKNIVDVLDELTISRRVSYKMAYRPLQSEERMIAAYKLYEQSSPKKPVLMHLPLYRCVRGTSI
ncbi:biopolymer transporter ExbD [Fibrella aquatica]|uniref:biopolymer transporter ExbD n=1 Tax=Fibrella aquatica TaxID=3242487 RepID=UPI003522338A